MLGGAPVTVRAQQPMTLTLPQAIELAQRQGLPARAAASSRTASEASERAFSGRRMPQLSFSSNPSYNRSIIPVIQPDGTTLFTPLQTTDALASMTLSQRLPFSGGTFGITSSLSQLRVTGAQNRNTYTSNPVALSLRQDILRPNALRWDRREQDLRLDFAEDLYRETREDIALNVSNAYFDLFASRTALRNAASNAATNDTLYTLNKGRFEIGKIGENDLLQSELALLRSRSTLDGAKLEYDRAHSAMRLALNAPVGAALEIVPPSTIPSFDADTTIAVGQALKNVSQQTGLALQTVQAKRRVAEAKLNNGIGASVQASVGLNSSAPQVNTAYNNLLQAQRFAVQVQVPLVQWGVRSSEVQAARSEQQRVEANADLARQQTAQDAKYAALQLSQARRNVLISAKSDTVATKRFEVAYNRYLIGKIGIDNLYIAQNEKDQALQQYVQSLRSFWTAYYRLRRLTLYDFERNAVIE
jgi:outer membrane protein TolC